MVKELNKKLNTLLNNRRITKEQFDDLKNVANITNFNEKILEWFIQLHEIEVPGWRNKLVTKKLCEVLMSGQPLHFYSLFCPSYVKGENKSGFRTDDVGNTTKNGLKRLAQIVTMTRNLGFNCNNPEAIFFDVALEQPEKTINMLDDLKENINNFKKYVPEDVEFCLLSKKFPELLDLVGYQGVVLDPLPVDDSIMKRIIERGKKFYQLFGWNDEQIIERSRVIASSEGIVGMFLRQEMPLSIMLYTPTMLERAQIYSGKHQDDPLIILVPKKDDMGL